MAEWRGLYQPRFRPMDTATILATIAVLHLLAVASPGPTFFVISSYALGGNIRLGLLVTLGVCLATLVWASIAAAGLSALLAGGSWLYLALQLGGAAYLIYLGTKMLVGALRKGEPLAAAGKPVPQSDAAAVRAGFVTNITNPKVAAYYASLFGVVIPTDAPGWLFPAASLTALLVSAVWWTSVTFFFSIPAVSRGYLRLRPKIDLVMGVALIALGARVALVR